MLASPRLLSTVSPTPDDRPLYGHDGQHGEDIPVQICDQLGGPAVTEDDDDDSYARCPAQPQQPQLRHLDCLFVPFVLFVSFARLLSHPHVLVPYFLLNLSWKNLCESRLCGVGYLVSGCLYVLKGRVKRLCVNSITMLSGSPIKANQLLSCCRIFWPCIRVFPDAHRIAYKLFGR